MSLATPQQMQLMARYGAWQNRQQTAAASRLDDAARRLDRAAFFGSIFGTLNHLLWADRAWLGRFIERPPTHAKAIGDSPRETEDWDRYCQARATVDRTLIDWADGLGEGDLMGDLAWWSSAAGREMRRPKALCALHMMNHATHHRGQVHAMLTAAGIDPGVTDLPFLPDDPG